ncbi:hypothetical protein PO415_24355, partial [Escherichia coli]
DGNGSHASTLKSPSYTKSVSWQHYLNMLGNMVSSVKDIIAGGNTNMRRTPGVREEKLKNINRDDKDGIKQ